jgi:hypothetical protein
LGPQKRDNQVRVLSHYENKVTGFLDNGRWKAFPDKCPSAVAGEADRAAVIAYQYGTVVEGQYCSHSLAKNAALLLPPHSMNTVDHLIQHGSMLLWNSGSVF